MSANANTTTPTTAFFRLLGLALGTTDDVDLLLDEAGWVEVYNLAHRHNVAALLLDGIEELHPQRKPPLGLLVPWSEEGSLIEQAGRRANQYTVAASHKFDEMGYAHTAIGGQVLAACYFHPLRRQPDGITLWFAHRQARLRRYAHRQFPRIKGTRQGVRFPVFPQTELNLAFCPAWLNHPRHNRLLQRFMQQQAPIMAMHRTDLPEVGEVPTLTPGLAMVVLATQMLRSLRSGLLDVRQLTDFYYLAVQLSERADEGLPALQLADRLGLRRFCASLVYVLTHLLGQQVALPGIDADGQYGPRLLHAILQCGGFQTAFKADRQGSEQASSPALPHWKEVVRQDYPTEQQWAWADRLKERWWRLMH